MKTALLSGLGLVMTLGVLPSGAQTVIGAKSGVINWVEGDVFLADQPYVMQPSQFGEVKEGQVFRTEEGRAEVLLPPGVFFRLGEVIVEGGEPEFTGFTQGIFGNKKELSFSV